MITRNKLLKSIASIATLLMLLALYTAPTHAASIKEQWIKVGNYHYLTRTAGNPKNEAIIFLHGYPETSYMWRNIMSDFADRGYYTVAFDQRGYSYRARPARVSEYQLSKLTGDVIGIANALKIDKFNLVGHDWGAILGWVTASEYSSRVKTLMTMSIGHPRAFFEAIDEGTQNSDYFQLFRIKGLFDAIAPVAAYFGYKTNGSSNAEISSYKSSLRRRGWNIINGYTGGLSWYRANGLTLDTVPNPKVSLANTKVPTVFVWGNADAVAGRVQAENTGKYVDAYYKLVEVNTGHGIIQNERAKVTQELLALIRRPAASTAKPKAKPKAKPVRRFFRRFSR